MIRTMALAAILLSAPVGPRQDSPVQVAYDAGWKAFWAGDAGTAEAKFADAAAKAEAFGPRSTVLAGCLHGRASALYLQRRGAEAEADERKALAIYEAASGKDSAEAGACLAGLGRDQAPPGRVRRREHQLRPRHRRAGEGPGQGLPGAGQRPGRQGRSAVPSRPDRRGRGLLRPLPGDPGEAPGRRPGPGARPGPRPDRDGPCGDGPLEARRGRTLVRQGVGCDRGPREGPRRGRPCLARDRRRGLCAGRLRRGRSPLSPRPGDPRSGTPAAGRRDDRLPHADRPRPVHEGRPRRGRADLSPRPGPGRIGPRQGPRPGPSPPFSPWPTCPSAERPSTRPNPCILAPWPSPRSSAAPTAPTCPASWTTSPCCCQTGRADQADAMEARSRRIAENRKPKA